MTEIYFDNSATTKISREALDAYVAASLEHWGNPSSRHARGKDAEDLMRRVREDVKKSLGVRDGEVLFTAGGTEANNLAIFGRATAKPRFRAGGVIVTTAGEHSSVTKPLQALAKEGFRILEIPTKGGKLDTDALIAALDERVVLVTMMLVNNESGAVYDLAEVGRLVRERCPDGVFHIDATQAYFKIPVLPEKLGADMVTLSSHKIEGPKGVGALWVSAGLIKNRGLVPVTLGGGQEAGFRSGTENVPGIAGFGAAVTRGIDGYRERAGKMNTLRLYLIEKIKNTPALAEVSVNLSPVNAPHILSITLPRIKSETMLHFLSSAGISVSSGSACSSHGTGIPSAMTAWGLSEKQADCTVRVSLSHENTKEECDIFLSTLADGVSRLIRIR